MEHPSADLLTLAANIVSAHVGHNDVGAQELPRLIREVYATLADVGGGGLSEAVVRAAAEGGRRKGSGLKAAGGSELLTCLECGMEMKMLKRHLLTVHGVTPETYREQHNLPENAPMVTSNYAELRSRLAKASGLGKRQVLRGRP